MTQRPAVLVTDGEDRAALAVVRSLGRAGYRLHVAARSRRSIAGASRHVSTRDVVADPLQSPSRFVDDVVAVVHRRGIAVVIPITDAALLALTADRSRLGDVLLPWPSAERVRRVADKALVTDAARELGIAVPAQRLVSTADEAIAAAKQLRCPLVIKPSRSVREQGSGRAVKLVVAHAADASALRSRLAELEPAAYPFLLQERIVGAGIGVSVLIRDGRLLAHFSHRRLRERPPSGGVSVYAESIAPDDALVQQSAALLQRLDWHGVAMIEYKVDATSGVPHLMEINGRFWGSLQLAIDAGVDFPALLLDAERGVPPRPATYRAGVRFRWWWGDVDHLLVRLARTPVGLSLPVGAPSRVQVIRQFLAAGWPHRDSDVFRADDVRPFVVETVDWARTRVAAAIGAARRARTRPTRAERMSSAAASPV
ncbi:MAG: ATP-grasp domain-containing protein [Gemmatimonadaceae bacterium]